MRKFIAPLLLVAVALTSTSVEAKSPKGKINAKPASLVYVNSYMETVAWFRDEFEHRTSAQVLIKAKYAECADTTLEKIRRVEESQKKGEEPCDGNLESLRSDLALCVKGTVEPANERSRQWAKCAYDQFRFLEPRAKEIDASITASLTTGDVEVAKTFETVQNFLLAHVGEVCGSVPKLGSTERHIGIDVYYPSAIESVIIRSRSLSTEINAKDGFDFTREATVLEWWTMDYPEIPVLNVCTLRKMPNKSNPSDPPTYEGCPKSIMDRIFRQ